MMNILVLGALMACLVPAYAQNAQEWKSTSVMQTSGSALAPQVTAVGATTVAVPATTTESYSPAQAAGGPRRVIGTNPDGGEGSNDSPIGDAVLPLLAFALMFCGYVAVRRKRSVNG